MRYRKVMIATDGSESAAKALRSAIFVAKACRAELWIVHAHDGSRPLSGALNDAVEEARAAGMDPKTEIQDGAGAEVILELADRRDADLIVVGTRGLSPARRLLVGSVSDRIARHAAADVLIVKQGCENGGYRRVLVGTDGSPTADRTSRKGYELADRLGAGVTLVFVGHPKTGEIVLRDTHQMLEKDLDATFRVLQGDPAEKIIDIAEEDDVDLIVLGNKGMTGARRFLLGSVPQKVLQYATRDVLIARTTTQVLSELARGDGGIVRLDGRKLAVYRDAQGDLHALSPKCTHLGCTVQWNTADKVWDCPCHGSRFAPGGEVLTGPATKPLPKTDV